MKSKKSCSNCIKGRSMTINSDILCREKGVVSPDYICPKYRPMPESKFIKSGSNKCIDCENFIVNVFSSNRTTFGLCQLFSVREFDGTQKNACSKFVQRSDSEVC